MPTVPEDPSPSETRVDAPSGGRRWVTPARVFLGLFLLLIVAPPAAAFILSWEMIFPEPIPPELLAPLPAPGQQIIAVHSSSFYYSFPIVLAEDGVTYSLEWTGEGGQWQVNSGSAQGGEATTWACDENALAALAGLGEPLRDCRTTRQMGEWCPAPKVSYALTDSGRVWELLEPQPCWFLFSLLFVYWLPIALGIMALVGFIWWVARLRRKWAVQETAAPTP